MKNSLFILFFLFLSELSFSQARPYRIYFSDNNNLDIRSKTGTADSTVFRLEVNTISNDLLAQGYLLANVDELLFSKDSLLAEINVGSRYTWSSLGTNRIPEEMLSKIGYRKRDFDGTNFSGKEFNSLITKILSQSANSGYPFASLQLQDIKVAGSSVEGVLRYDQGPIIYYDSLTVIPDKFIKNAFLENYLRVRKGTLFQLKTIENLENAINRLPYCQLNDSIQMSFQNNLCNIHIRLNPVKANKIDALIGFLPNQGEENGLLLTGYVNLHLQNLFRSGKELSFVWRQFQVQSQKLFVKYRHPNLFKSPVGLSFSFDLLKQDSVFLNTNLNIEGYYSDKKWEVSFSTMFNSSRALSVPIDTTRVPLVADYNIQQLGTRIAYNGILNNTNPQKGSMAFVNFSVGNKRIKKNPNVISEVYDSINLNPIQMIAKIGGEVNQTVRLPFILHLDAQAATLINNDQLFANDLMRLGGVNSLRGFNDLEFFVSSYLLFRFEARLLIGKTSRLFVFYDQAWIANEITKINDAPRGFGAGLKLDTGKGDLQLVYGLGVSGQQSLSLTQSKIHIGYVARF